METRTKIDIPATHDWLPTMPMVGLRIVEMFADDNVAIVDIAREIKVDPVLTARLMHTANSPLYRSKSEILSIEHAVSWLGKSEVAGLVLSLDLGKLKSDHPSYPKLFQEYWRQSFIQGCAMSRIAESTGQFPQNEAYICGLLMDLGRLLMIDGNCGGYDEVVNESRSLGTPLRDVELQRIGRTHAEIGKELLDLMGLPERFGQVAFCHDLTIEKLAELEESDEFALLAAAVSSNAIGNFYCRNNQAESLGTVEAVCRKYLRMSESDIQHLLASVNEDIEKKAELYSVDVKEMVPMGQLVGHTNGQIKNQSAAKGNSQVLVEEVESLRRLVSSLEQRACHDSMTGIHNRDYFTAMLNERVNNKGDDKPFAVLVIDIDKFKSINDTHGHISGDFAITWTARRIASFFPNDLVARYGGDEFVGIIDCENINDITDRLTQLCESVGEETKDDCNIPERFTISVGAVVCSLAQPNPAMSSRAFSVADEAMYEAKQAGGGRCTVKELISEATASEPSAAGAPAALIPNSDSINLATPASSVE